ncbi:MAG: hypothetical protein FJW27_00415 [Acidimicrobiia bacterium]|nr:hypothetical protein [Acidimicrobiia bacterium]
MHLTTALLRFLCRLRQLLLHTGPLSNGLPSFGPRFLKLFLKLGLDAGELPPFLIGLFGLTVRVGREPSRLGRLSMGILKGTLRLVQRVDDVIVRATRFLMGSACSVERLACVVVLPTRVGKIGERLVQRLAISGRKLDVLPCARLRIERRLTGCRLGFLPGHACEIDDERGEIAGVSWLPKRALEGPEPLVESRAPLCQGVLTRGTERTLRIDV